MKVISFLILVFSLIMLQVVVLGGAINVLAIGKFVKNNILDCPLQPESDASDAQTSVQRTGASTSKRKESSSQKASFPLVVRTAVFSRLWLYRAVGAAWLVGVGILNYMFSGSVLIAVFNLITMGIVGSVFLGGDLTWVSYFFFWLSSADLSVVTPIILFYFFWKCAGNAKLILSNSLPPDTHWFGPMTAMYGGNLGLFGSVVGITLAGLTFNFNNLTREKLFRVLGSTWGTAMISTVTALGISFVLCPALASIFDKLSEKPQNPRDDDKMLREKYEGLATEIDSFSKNISEASENVKKWGNSLFAHEQWKDVPAQIASLDSNVTAFKTEETAANIEQVQIDIAHLTEYISSLRSDITCVTKEIEKISGHFKEY